MSGGKSLKVSLCMIARDEELRIAEAIGSVRNMVDEMILVDTGSQDRTIQIAEANGAVVYRSEWTGNFSAARNLGLSKARGEWVLVLDADEILEPIASELFFSLLEKKPIGGYFIKILSLTGVSGNCIADKAVRLFRNRPDYRFHGAIHEQIAGSILAAGDGLKLAEAGLTLIHYGYLPEEIIRKDKAKRNQVIIRREMAARPGDPFPLYCLGIELLQQNAYQEGYLYLEKAFCRMNGREGYFPHMALTLALGYCLAEDYAGMARIIETCPEEQKGIAEIKFAQGVYYYKTGKLGKAICCWEQLIKQGGQPGEVSPDIVASLLGDAYFEIQDYQTAEIKYYEALKFRPEDCYALKRLLAVRQQGCSYTSWQSLSQFLPPVPVPGLLPAFLSYGETKTAIVFALLYVLRYFQLPEQSSFVIELLLSISDEFPSVGYPQILHSIQEICRKELILLLRLRNLEGQTDWNQIYENQLLPLLEMWLSIINWFWEDGGNEKSTHCKPG